MKNSVLCVSTLLAASAAAVPNVTPVPVEYPGKCVNYPNWINTRDHDLTGSFMFTIATADDTTLNNLLVQPFSIPWAGSTRWLLGADFIPASAHNPAQYYRCFDGVPAWGSNSADNITIARDMENAHLLVSAPQETAYIPQLYYLQGEDGKRLDGVYLGAEGKATWGFVFREPTCSADGKASWPFMEVKLLGLPVDEANPPTAGYPAESQGFVKVIGW